MSARSRASAQVPLLSVLIPAYNFPEGVGRALASMGPLRGRTDVEVVVSDDSTDMARAEAIEQLTAGCDGVRYAHNRPPLGAARNWNHLLRQARGKYCLILHHDEYFESSSVLADILQVLAAPHAPDGVVLPCKIDKGGRQLRRHMPTALSRWVVRRLPGYLLRRNVLGSPSVWVLRRSRYEPFDERLQWYVDVELYARVLARRSTRWVFLQGSGIVSDLSLETSITRTLKDGLVEVRRCELELMQRSGALVGRGSWLMGTAALARVARPIESLAWAAFRVMWRAGQSLRAVVPARSPHA